jgi:hypothetical protein
VIASAARQGAEEKTVLPSGILGVSSTNDHLEIC